MRRYVIMATRGVCVIFSRAPSSFEHIQQFTIETNLNILWMITQVSVLAMFVLLICSTKTLLFCFFFYLAFNPNNPESSFPLLNSNQAKRYEW